VRRRAEERGAMAVLTAIITSIVLFAVGAIVIDIGTQRSARRDMQALADVIALDLARQLDGRTASQIYNATPSLQTLANTSRDRNDSTIGSTAVVTTTLGKVLTDGTFATVGSGDVPTAVRVTAQTSVDFGIGVGTGDANRTAVGTSDVSACFSIGSYAARLDTSSSTLLDSILNKILGGSSNLDVLSYTGLINANVSLLDIALQLGLGSVDELLASSINAGTFLIAAANVLQANGTSNASVLNTVAAQLGGFTLHVGDLISAEPGSGAAETATINALDLLTGTVLLANGSNALSIPSLATNLPLSGTGLTTSLSLIEKARHKCGKKGVTADTAQLTTSINGNIASGQTALGLPLTGTTAIAISAASAHGVLTDVICGAETAASPSGEDVQVTSGLVGASAQVSFSFANLTTSGTANIDNGLIAGITSLLNLLGLNKVASITVNGSIGLKVSTGDPSTIKTAKIRVPNNPTTWNKGVSTGSGDLGLSTTSVTTVSNTLTFTAKNFLGVNVTLTTSQITAITANLVSKLTSTVLNPLVSSLNTNVLSPLWDVLGVTVGGADVYGERPSCNDPSLVG
jgi:uncharacterized membrane protein